MTKATSDVAQVPNGLRILRGENGFVAFQSEGDDWSAAGSQRKWAFESAASLSSWIREWGEKHHQPKADAEIPDAKAFDAPDAVAFVHGNTCGDDQDANEDTTKPHFAFVIYMSGRSFIFSSSFGESKIVDMLSVILEISQEFTKPNFALMNLGMGGHLHSFSSFLSLVVYILADYPGLLSAESAMKLRIS